MATRSRKSWKPNNNEGVYQRQVGWKLSRNRKQVQHKFRFACALKEAQRREQKIVELWERIEATTFGREPQWSDATIEIAKQIAAGKEPIQIRREPDEGEVAYVRRVHDLRKRFPTFAILPELEYGHAFGLRTLEWMDAHETSDKQLTEERAERSASLLQHLEGSDERNGPTLHQAMKDYIQTS